MPRIRKAHIMIAATKAGGMRLGFGAVLLLACASASFGGTFVALQPANFVRSTGKPVAVTVSFTVLNPNTAYTLHIDNGGEHGEFARVSSAVILLNGVQVVGPSGFNRNVTVMTKPITLVHTNTVSVELRSQPGSGITLQITGIDDDLPTITATAQPPPNAAGWNQAPVTVSFSCADTTSEIATCSAPNTVSTEGTNQMITGTAIDRAGNTETRSVTLNIDTTPPGLSPALTPAPNSNGWNNTDVTVSFAATDSLSGVATVTEPVTLTTEGANQGVSGTAADQAGNSSIVSTTVNLDKTPPSVNITSPAHGITLHTPETTVTGTVSDVLSSIASVTCNGLAASISGSTFLCPLSLSEGANAIVVQATDMAGNASTAHITVTFVRILLVTITAPANLSYFNISPTTVTGTVDNPTATVTVNAIPAAVVNGRFSVALPLAEGPNLVTASASAPTGAVGVHSIQVTLDTTPPRVTITSPPDPFVTTDTAISVAGIVNDIVVGTVNDQQAQVTVNGATAQVANRTFLATNVPLVLGTNVIQAVGRDRVGNAATTQITVMRQALTQAQIRLISGNNQTGAIGSLLPAPLVVALTDATGNPVANKPVIVKVTQNDGMVAAGGPPAPAVIATTNAQGQAQVQWTLGARVGAGANAVEAYAVGFAGTALFAATGTPGPAGHIVVDTGNAQIGVITQPLPRPLLAVVVDSGNNRLADVPVTFTVIQGGGSFAGQPSVTVTTDSDGRAAAILTLGPQEGNANNLVEATFPSNQGFPAAFTASGRVSRDPAHTTISGVVLDNSNVPIPGVTIRAVLTNILHSNATAVQSVAAVQTDAHGQFSIPQAPVGFVKLLVDGSTAQRPGQYPALEYDLVTVAGQNNTVGMPIYLLPLSTQNQLCVTATTDGGTLTIPDAPGFSLTFGPGQVTFPGGSKTGCVSVTVVHGDKVPMVPGFGQQPRFIVTIQPAGAVFNPPAPITLPNVDGLKPRAVTEMYSFDHDIGSFVAIGTGIVSDDGQVIRSSPGVGVLKAGWHCGGDPSKIGTVADCPDCKICHGNGCVPDPTIVPTITVDGQSPDNFQINTQPRMPAITATATVNPSGAKISWEAQITFTAPAGCSGGPNFNSPVLRGNGTSFTPNFPAIFGGELRLTANTDCGQGAQNSLTRNIRADDPGREAIQDAIGNADTPFDPDDLKRMACQESRQIQFLANGLPKFGPGGSPGIFQICFQRTAADVWNWRANIQRGRQILATFLAFSRRVPTFVRTMRVRGRGPFPEARDFTDEELRREAIKRYNAGTHLDRGYWEWSPARRTWEPNPQGGGDPAYVAHVIAQDPTCP